MYTFHIILKIAYIYKFDVNLVSHSSIIAFIFQIILIFKLFLIVMLVQ